jgi:Tat protein secretion system quality control protein TatD with DNase activity
MSGFMENRKKKLAGATHGGSLHPGQSKQYPTLRQMMEGVKNEKGEELLPQFTLTFFLGEDGLDFVFRQKGDRKKDQEAYFGSVGGAIDVLAAVETSLDSGDVRLKLETGPKF